MPGARHAIFTSMSIRNRHLEIVSHGAVRFHEQTPELRRITGAKRSHCREAALVFGDAIARSLPERRW
jgi:hypothetical protein